MNRQKGPAIQPAEEPAANGTALPRRLRLNQPLVVVVVVAVAVLGREAAALKVSHGVEGEERPMSERFRPAGNNQAL